MRWSSPRAWQSDEDAGWGHDHWQLVGCWTTASVFGRSTSAVPCRAVAGVVFQSIGPENGVVADPDGDHQGDWDIERVRALTEPFMRRSPAMTRLIEAIKATPELRELTGWADTHDDNDHKRTSARTGRSPRPTQSPERDSGGPRVVATSAVIVNASEVLPLVVDYANGMTQAEIAAKHGLHIQTVRKRLTQVGINSRERNRALGDEDLWRARRLIDSGVSVREVARQFGVAHTTLLRALKRAGSARSIPPVTRGAPTDDDMPTTQRTRSAELRRAVRHTPPPAEDPDATSGNPPRVQSGPSPATSVQDEDGGVLAEGSIAAAVVRSIKAPHRYLTDVGMDSLVADYLAGVAVGELAGRYGIHRSTVTAHLRRRNIPRRRVGLDSGQQAEAVGLYRDGLSLRAISRRMGVDRKTVRASLVEANLVSDV